MSSLKYIVESKARREIMSRANDTILVSVWSKCYMATKTDILRVRMLIKLEAKEYK